MHGPDSGFKSGRGFKSDIDQEFMSPGIRAFIFLATMAVVAGCDPKARHSDESEREHPAIKKARELESAGDIEGARFIYQALLDRDPSVARAHLGLAFLLEKQGSNSCLLYTSPSPRDRQKSRMPSSA